MDLMLLRLFQRQVADNCKVALHGVEVMNHGLTTSNQDAIWVGVPILLTGAANAAKALWGQKGKLAAEREALRLSLEVDDTSPLKDVDMRNNFEHYDERLDRWWIERPKHIHVDRVVGPPNTVGGVDDKDRFRAYDTTTHDIIFWGERFNVQAIVTELSRIQPIAEREATRPHWPEHPGPNAK
ncbi:hypothetical protein BOH72_01450 [Mycobacterium sp. WY10]|nr:hypothetical protein BOH72_01450 [Mycobacterium sp. WY10]